MVIHYISLAALPILDRLAGSDAKIPGKKNLRRIGIPLIIWLQNPTLIQGILCAILGVILSTNLDEIEERDWDDVFNYSVALSIPLWPICGPWGLVVSCVWFGGVLWSNIGLFGHKIDWKWVEVGRGLAFSIAILIGGK